MDGVHGLLASHMNDHGGKIMSCINKLPLPPDEKVLLQAIENMQEASLGQTVEAVEKIRKHILDLSTVKGGTDEKVLLQAIEAMQEASLGETLDNIQKLRSALEK